MKNLCVMIVAAVTVLTITVSTSAIAMPTTQEAETAWKPSENRFRGCKKGFKLDAVGRCVKWG